MVLLDESLHFGQGEVDLHGFCVQTSPDLVGWLHSQGRTDAVVASLHSLQQSHCLCVATRLPSFRHYCKLLELYAQLHRRHGRAGGQAKMGKRQEKGGNGVGSVGGYNSWMMQKELKSLDRQLKNNGLLRVADSSSKHDYSLFRALSIAVYYSPLYVAEVVSEVRLTLMGNLGDKRNNAYPVIHDSPVLKKYHAMPELLLDFLASPELACYQNDVLVVASAAFGRNITVYSLDKDDYLNELYISACKNPREQRLCLARAAKKYFAVLPLPTHDILPFLRGPFLDEILSAIFDARPATDPPQQQDRIHYPHYDQVVTGRRQHKKSLSDCGDLPLTVQPFEERKKELQESSDRGSAFPPTSKPFDHYEDEFFEGGYSRGYSLDAFEQPIGYYNYPYPYYPQQEAAFPYVESAPVNNQRYTGRLKFFDQAGNYGFIVIDSLNLDLFVHYDDLSKAGLSKEKLLALKNNYELRFQFTYYEYEGKQHKKSKKAVDLQLIQE